MGDKVFITAKLLDHKRINPIKNNAECRYAQPVCLE
ncbi:MAG: hypothetical protein JWR54_1177 [Mucilaginibacter sp.]|nr:hypothetical protein [Mucilaginibacter sp.]